jgi:transcriptional regulator with XRE-family HTH domain
MPKAPSFPNRFLGALIKDRRTQKGLSQATVAFDLGYKSPKFLSDVERGLRLLPEAKIGHLAKILGVESAVLCRQIDRDRRSKNKKSNLEH